MKQILTVESSAKLSFERPLVSTDLAIFTVSSGALRVLLVQRADGDNDPFAKEWSLPGGFVDTSRDASLVDSALRKLREKTGVLSPYLEQVGSWGGATRDPRGWSTTHVYFALLSNDSVALKRGGNAADARWFDVPAARAAGGAGRASAFPLMLAFDHRELFNAALSRLRDKVEYTSLPVYLMPAEFTLTELQRTYEIVLDRELEKKAFRTRMLAADFLIPSRNLKEGPNRPAQLFRLANAAAPHFFSRPFGSADRSAVSAAAERR